MFKHLIIYTFFYVCACFAQIVNPVTIDVTSDSLVRAGEVVNIEISAKMEKQWKIYSIYNIIYFYFKYFKVRYLRIFIGGKNVYCHDCWSNTRYWSRIN